MTPLIGFRACVVLTAALGMGILAPRLGADSRGPRAPASQPASQSVTQERHRVVVLTDIEADPDDTQSLVRLLLYANAIDIEALIATTSVHQKTRVAPESIRTVIEAYARVQPNLEKHERGFPAAESIASHKVCRPTAWPASVTARTRPGRIASSNCWSARTNARCGSRCGADRTPWPRRSTGFGRHDALKTSNA